MPAGPFIVTNNALQRIVDGTISLTSNTFVATLMTSAMAAAPTLTTWGDVSTTEASGSGYTAGGLALGSFSITRSGGVVTIDTASNPTWNPATIAAKFVVVTRRAGGSLVSGDLLLGYMDLNDGGGNLSSVNSPFVVEWSSNGLFTLARSP